MTTRERLALAAAISAALHAFLVARSWLAVEPPAGHSERPLEVLLQPEPRGGAVTGALAPRARAPAPARKRAAADPAAVTGPRPAALAHESPPQPETDSAAIPPSSAELAEPPQPAPAEVPPGRDEPPATTAAGHALTTRALPASGTITFVLNYGRDGFGVGRAAHTWEIAGGTYQLAADAETTGIAELFRPQRLRWLARGAVTDAGLKPQSFQASRTRRGEAEASEARFDWGKGALTYGPARARAAAALPAGTLDILTFIYHLALNPPGPGRFSVPITTGSRFETYEIEVRAEEEIETPLGRVRALPVRQQARPGAESIEIWLGAEYRYLPVRIRYYDRDGAFAGEQAATGIRVSEHAAGSPPETTDPAR